jgi:hypothetical protein
VLARVPLPTLNLNILPNPITCANHPGGVNSVVTDHAAGFLAKGCEINKHPDGLKIIHALAEVENADIFHCHGLYPIGEGYFDKRYSKANAVVLKNALQAKVTVCVSEFAAELLRHKLHIDPIVVRNGIWLDEYSAAGSASGPILFPKANLDANARADEVLWLKENTDFPLLSIAKIPSVKSTGAMTRDAFKNVIRNCSVYLGTTKENNSMATMEAMISGVPVVGYNIGFNSEWLASGVGCELVDQGDKPALKEAIRKVRSNWKKYSLNARAYAGVFDWQPAIDELLDLYDSVSSTPDHRAVSIIIPVHNYERYLAGAIESALAQTIRCEIIVVDDQSSDHSAEIARSYKDKGVKLVSNKINLGVAETRNIGIRKAKGNYIICLDADDMILPTFAETHLAAFSNRQDAIAYAPINLVDENGRGRNIRWFTKSASVIQQRIGHNQVPSCCMFRKEYWVRAGGYDKRYSPAEDANLWLKIFSIGGLAKQASSQTLMNYRTHNGSLSSSGVFPEWWQGYPDFTAPIEERSEELEIVLSNSIDVKEAKEILWLLENQKIKNWSCLTLAKQQAELRQTFPWLKNIPPTRSESLIEIKAGTQLPPNFLTQYAEQMPPWTTGARSLSH